MPEGYFYIRFKGRQEGPYSIDQLKTLRSLGRFSSLHQVSEDGQHWGSAGRLNEVFDVTPKTTPTMRPAGTGTSRSVDVLMSQPTGPHPTPGSNTDNADVWYYSIAGQQCGPVTLSALRDMLARNDLSADTPIWSHTLSAWTAANLVAGFTQAPRKSLSSATFLPWILIATTACVSLICVIGGIFWFAGSTTSGNTIARHSDTEKINRAVALVVTGFQHELNGDHREYQFGTGTGFTVTPDGYIITNKHVIESVLELKKKTLKATVRPMVWVFFSPQLKYEAEIQYHSSRFDMAILKIAANNLPHFRLTKSAPDLSSKVFAIGYPGLNRNAFNEHEKDMEAILTARSNKDLGLKAIELYFKDRDFICSKTDGTVNRITPETGININWIEHSAILNPGNSGGPLCQENGAVVGINTLGRKEIASIFCSFCVGSAQSEINEHIPGVKWLN